MASQALTQLVQTPLAALNTNVSDIKTGGIMFVIGVVAWLLIGGRLFRHLQLQLIFVVGGIIVTLVGGALFLHGVGILN